VQKTSGDVILEQDQSGNNYLHLILPADRINFLHGSGSSFFKDSKVINLDESDNDPDSKMLIEVGCKVYEVNRVLYRNQPSKGSSLLAQL
jgi:hypothetical protein